MSDKHMKRRRNRHAFLFRHCVRSTKSNIELYNGGENASQHAADYTARPLPKWNSPDEWCTETATEIMQNTGSFLLENT
jgi:hypothetical protein